MVSLVVLLGLLHLGLHETALPHSPNQLPVALLVFLQVTLGNKTIEKLLGAHGVLLLGFLYLKPVLELPVHTLQLSCSVPLADIFFFQL